ncbi:hypothetical protein M0804_001080 [Polistes exclamans]|nr:hypothetical protein M0804_001080 [Polistes exclamans]
MSSIISRNKATLARLTMASIINVTIYHCRSAAGRRNVITPDRLYVAKREVSVERPSVEVAVVTTNKMKKKKMKKKKKKMKRKKKSVQEIRSKDVRVLMRREKMRRRVSNESVGGTRVFKRRTVYESGKRDEDDDDYDDDYDEDEDEDEDDD